MVERIVDAGEAVLIAHGYDGASTNRIADTARISPGSLYQYFPNKDAIVTAVIQRHCERIESHVHSHVVANLTAPPEVGVPATISVLLDALSSQPQLLRAMVEQTPRLESVVAFERQIGELSRAGLALHRNLVPDDVDPEAVSWMLVRTVEHLTIRYVLDHPPISREKFLADITRLVLNFFR